MQRIFTIMFLVNILGWSIAGMSDSHAGMLCLEGGMCLTDSTPVVIDGDTLALDHRKYRLWGIDAPEKDQPYGLESRDCLERITSHGAVLAMQHKDTSYDREVAIVYTVEVTPNGVVMRDIAERLLTEGCAWHDATYAPFKAEYRLRQEDAVGKRVGLWAHEGWVAPWEWRARRKKDQGSTERGHTMFITVEGLDGCGKTTQLAQLADWLTGKGYDVWQTAEPTSSVFGKTLQDLPSYVWERLPQIQLALFLADRMVHQEAIGEHYHDRWDGQTFILCDRYIHSTCAYQAVVAGMSLEEIWTMQHDVCFEPSDLALYLRVSPDLARYRKPWEGDHAALYRVYAHYEKMAQDPEYGLTTIDASRSIGEVQDDIRRHVLIKLEELA